MKKTLLLFCWLPLATNAVEHKFSGLIDTRASHVSGLKSHVDGHYGKFRFDDGNNFALAQGIIKYQASFDWPITLHVTGSSYSDGIKDDIGLLEAHLKYKSLPNNNGHRFSSRAGIFYPQISLENNAIGWSSPYTLTYSTMNSWLGEELRHAGLEFSWQRLGKFNQQDFDLGLNASVFKNNDTLGTLLSWRGWTQSSRQTLWHETLPLPPVKARFGGWLRFQAPETDPFKELDHRYGFEVNGYWQWQQNIKINAGYYDNNADTRVFKKGQYAWQTTFYHLGIKSRLPGNVQLIAQLMHGDTLMTSPWGMPVVDNGFQSAYLLLSKKLSKHRFTTRLEEFSVDDTDQTPDDDNDEYGKSFTLSYQYHISKPLLVQLEYNWLDSTRPARQYDQQATRLTERQIQLALKFYW